MNIASQLQVLKSVAAKLDIEIQYTNLKDREFMFQSGYCKINQKNIIILDKKLSGNDQINIILTAFEKFDLNSIYLPPWLRDRLEESPLGKTIY